LLPFSRYLFLKHPRLWWPIAAYYTTCGFTTTYIPLYRLACINRPRIHAANQNPVRLGDGAFLGALIRSATVMVIPPEIPTGLQLDFQEYALSSFCKINFRLKMSGRHSLHL